MEWVFQAPEKHWPQCIWLLIDGNCICFNMFFSGMMISPVFQNLSEVCRGGLVPENLKAREIPERRSVGSLKTGDCVMIAEKSRQEDAEEPRAPSWS